LRTPTDAVGMEWVYPLQRDPSSGCGIVLDLSTATSDYHSALILGLGPARFFLVDHDVLCARLDGRNARPRTWGDLPLPHAFALSEPAPTRYAVLARAPTNEAANARAQAALQLAQTRYQALLAEDAAFYATCPQLDGDWPAGWREGLHYDFETTRMLVQPKGGIFHDVWPGWMVAWPRVVLAEGTLDMLRLALADPALAQRAVHSMFRDAPMPNVPCVFEDGSYNMLAADGSSCGTSPAWCLPFLNLELLYARTLDRAWLRELYPYLVAYIEWWLAERTDPEGWVVYKCTWESGEDGNPRLDPTGSGDAVIDRRVRPVELQATMAHAARVMCFFARELGLPSSRWRTLEARYRRRTRELFDAETQRHRDWLVAENRFQPERPDRPYWGTDTGRFSPLGLTPALIGEPVSAEEVWRHATPPWTLWPSWTYALVESAAADGIVDGLGALVASIVDRVYRVTTRHTPGDLPRPLPGVSPEFWPEDWHTYQGHDAYGWGATTANLLVRHLFGFQESRYTRGWRATLIPNFPPELMAVGRRFGIRQLNYRGCVFDLAYQITPDGLEAHMRLPAARASRVRRAGGPTIYHGRRQSEHRFRLLNGQRYVLDLQS
jgi:hypothetical protein